MAELTVLYDGACNLCRASVARVRRMDPGARIEMLDLHDASVAARFPQLNLDEAMRLMQAVDPAWACVLGSGRLGSHWIGAARLEADRLAAARAGIHFVAQHFYAWVARNRYRWNRELCEDGTCALHVDQSSAPKEKRRQ